MYVKNLMTCNTFQLFEGMQKASTYVNGFTFVEDKGIVTLI